MTTAAALRTRWAIRAGRAAAALSRRLGVGDGTVVGGRVTLALAPDALRAVGAGRWTALVSGTNGKTTTTRLLTAALRTAGPVVTNPQGSNLPPGLVAGLGAAPTSAAAALEVDEAWLGIATEALAPSVIALLNLSRDQLDRVAEVRRLADRWRRVVAGHPDVHVVANADDPLVVWAASGAPHVTWASVGQPWTEDATGCPSCGGRLAWPPPAAIGDTPPGAGWRCVRCGFGRPDPDAWLDGDALVVGGARHELALALPGRANRANAVMASLVAARRGLDHETAVAAMRGVRDVDGRYRLTTVGPTSARLLLAKNPAGWLEVFGMLAPAPAPVVVVVNARIADGRDPSWLWDVPFERLRGRTVLAAGERSRDVAVRLRYAGVAHRRVDDPVEAIAALGTPAADVAANYTAMRDLDRRLGGRRDR